MLSRRRKVNFCHCVMFSYASIFVTLSSARKRIQTSSCIPRLDGRIRISTFGQIHTKKWTIQCTFVLTRKYFQMETQMQLNSMGGLLSLQPQQYNYSNTIIHKNILQYMSSRKLEGTEQNKVVSQLLVHRFLWSWEISFG